MRDSHTVTVIAGTLGGASLATALLAFAALLGPSGLLGSPIVMAITTPAARLVSMASGLPLQMEAAMVCYALGLLLTTAVAGAVLGGAVGALAGGTRA